MFNVQTKFIHTDKVLTQFSIRYENAAFTADMLLPPVKVDKESDKYKIFKRDGWFKGAPKKADGAITEEVSLAYDEATYTVYERAIKDFVTDRAMSAAEAPIRPKIDTTEFLTEKLRLSEEIDTYSLLVSTSGLDQSGYRLELTTAAAWTDGTATTILKNISTAMVGMVKAIAQRPNILVMTTETSEGIIQQAEVRDILKLQNTGVVTAANPLPSLRGLNITIADALYDNSDTPGTLTFEYVIGNNALLVFSKTGHPLTIGRKFFTQDFNVARWRDEDRTGEYIKVNKIYSPKITTLAAGYIFLGVKGGHA